MKQIDYEIYKDIHSLMPIPGVDLYVIHDRRLLLLKRRRQPEEGRWWTPGGRLGKGETILDCCRRVARKECNLEIIPVRFLGTMNYMSKSSPFNTDLGTHTVTQLWLCQLPATLKWDEKVVEVDQDHSSHCWFNTDALRSNPAGVPNPILDVVEHLGRLDMSPIHLEVSR